MTQWKHKQSPQQRANLRTCMSCEWIYEGEKSCPKCGWASYGARFVYGDRAYKFKITQEPWKRRMMDDYEMQLDEEIKRTNPIKEKDIYEPTI